MNEIILEINSYVSDEFSDEEMAAFYSVLHRINENLKKAEDKFCREARKEENK